MPASAFNHLVKDSIIYGLGQILSRFIGFLLLPLFTSYLTPQDYGIIAILGIMNLVVISLFSFGFNVATGLCYFDSDDTQRKAETLWSSLAILAASVFALGMAALIAPVEISGMLFQTADRARLVSLSLLSAALIILNTQLLLFLMFEKRAVLYVTITSFITVFTLMLSVIAVVALGRGVGGMIESMAAANATGLVLLLIPAVRHVPFRLNGAIARSLMRYGLPLIPSAIFLFLIQQVNQYLLQRYRGLDEVGVYLIGFNFGLVMNVLVSAFSSAWYPHFMSYMTRQAEARDTFGRILSAYVLGFGVLSLLFYSLAKPVVMIMTQQPFHDAYRVVGPAATAFLLGGLFVLLLPAVYFAKDVKYVSVIQGISAAGAIGFNVWLIPRFGMAGAVLSLVLGHVILVLMQIAWNRLKRRQYFQIHYEWKRILRFCIPYAGLATLALWPRTIGLSHEIVYSGVLTAGSLFLLFASLTAGEKRWIASWIGTRSKQDSTHGRG